MEESHHCHGKEKNDKRLLDRIDAKVKLGGDGREGWKVSINRKSPQHRQTAQENNEKSMLQLRTPFRSRRHQPNDGTERRLIKPTSQTFWLRKIIPGGASPSSEASVRRFALVFGHSHQFWGHATGPRYLPVRGPLQLLLIFWTY